MLTSPPIILRSSVAAVMLPSGLRLVPAILANWQADSFLTSPQFDWHLHRKFPIKRVWQSRPEHKHKNFDSIKCFTCCLSCSTSNLCFWKTIWLLEDKVVSSPLVILRSWKWNLSVPVLLFLFLTPCTRQRARDEKRLYTSDCFWRGQTVRLCGFS